MKTLLNLEKVCRSYDDIQVLNDIDLEIKEQEIVGIMGKSGSGKTTLLRLLGLIDLQNKGVVWFDEKNTNKLWEDELADIRRRHIGFVFQDYYLLNSLNVKENIMLPMLLDKSSKERCIENTEKWTKRFEIFHLLSKYPYELSGGEKQRVAICRALINEPDIILADEPTGNLDSISGKRVIDTLTEINLKLNKTIVLITHDPQIASYCKRIVFLKDGRIVNEIYRKGSQEEFMNEILKMINKL